MYCGNCGFKLHKPNPNYCPECGLAIIARPTDGKRSRNRARPSLPTVGGRISVVLYVIAYLALIGFSIGVGITINQYMSAPDPRASYVTCRSGTKVSYRALGIRDPATDPGNDNLLIDAACRNLGGNTYTNVAPGSHRVPPWQYGLAVFTGGVIIIEILKGTLVYLIKGYFPGPGTLKQR
jgi:hypothetical protein